MVRWSCAFACPSWTTEITPRTPFKPFSWCLRKAASIRDGHLLGTWLYGVSIRIARKARARLARLRRNEESNIIGDHTGDVIHLVASAAPSPEDSAIAREEAEAVHDEIDRLPMPFRMPVALCYFEGLSLDQAAPGSSGRREQSAAGWHGREKSFAAGSSAAASCCPLRRWPLRSLRDRPPYPSRPRSATRRPELQSALRLEEPRHPLRRRLRLRCSNPCS